MIRVVVIFGGASSEHDVSCASARDVAAALNPARFDVSLLGIDRAGRWHAVDAVSDLPGAVGGSRLPALDAFDVAIPVLHGLFGEDGTVQGLLEMAGLPYAGCGVLASALAMDKRLTGAVLSASGIRAVETVAVSSVEGARDRVAHLGFPVFVKPNRAGSSVGVTRVESVYALDAAVAVALEHDAVALVQPLMVGDEIDVGVLELPDGSLRFGAPLRVRPGEGSAFFDFAAKYTPGGASFEVPAAISAELEARLLDVAERSFRALGCSGISRVDSFVDADGEITVNEVNTLPGMSALSQFPRMFAAIGMPLTEVLDVLVDRALATADSRPSESSRLALEAS